MGRIATTLTALGLLMALPIVIALGPSTPAGAAWLPLSPTNGGFSEGGGTITYGESSQYAGFMTGVNSRPDALAANGAVVYVMDTGWGAIQRVDTATGEITAGVDFASGAGREIAYDAVTGDVLVPTETSLAILNGTTLATVQEIPLGAYSCASDVVISGSTAWVADPCHDRLVQIDLTTGTVVSTVALGGAPTTIVLDGANDPWVVENSRGQVQEIVGGMVTRTIALSDPQAAALDPANGDVVVGGYSYSAGNGYLDAIDPSTGAVTRLLTGTSYGSIGYRGVAWAPALGEIVAVDDSAVDVVNPTTGAVERLAAPAGWSDGVSVAVTDSMIWVAWDLPTDLLTGTPESSLAWAQTVPLSPTAAPSGTVTVTTGTTPLCTATLSAPVTSLSATTTQWGCMTPTTLPVGSYSAEGQYSGDANYQPTLFGRYTSETLTVTPAPTGLTATASTTSAVEGAPVTLAASVAGPAPVDGEVGFSLGTTQLCTATVTNGSGDCTTTKLPLGVDTVDAGYRPDANHLASSGTVTVRVSPDLPVPIPSATSLTVSSTSLAPGVPVTLSTAVTSASENVAPGGTVTITAPDASLFNCVDLPLQDGKASCTTSFGAGTYELTATYHGSPYFVASSSQPVTLVVSQPLPVATPTAVGLTIPSTVTLPAPIPASIRVSAAGGGAPTGTVTVAASLNGSRSGANCTAALVPESSGTGSEGTCNIVVDTPGAYALTASFAGGHLYLPSTATATTSVVSPTTTVLMGAARNLASPDSGTAIDLGQTFWVRTLVSVPNGIQGTPTGHVVVSLATPTDRPAGSCTATLALGASTGEATGVCPLQPSVPGQLVLVGRYLPSSPFFAASASVPIATSQVGRGPTAVGITVSPASPVPGAPVTLTTTVYFVSPSSEYLDPGGTVTFAASGDPISGCADLTLTGGKATCTTSFAAGTYELTVVYPGSPDFTASSLAPPFPLVVAGPTQLTATPPAATPSSSTPAAATPSRPVTAPPSTTVLPVTSSSVPPTQAVQVTPVTTPGPTAAVRPIATPSRHDRAPRHGTRTARHPARHGTPWVLVGVAVVALLAFLLLLLVHRRRRRDGWR